MGSTQKLREALAGGPARDKERKEPAVADGILSVTPDPPESAEWRNKSVLDIVAADSSFHQAEDAAGKRPTQLFGKFTWRIENFTELKGSKRELRSAQFDVGEYKWLEPLCTVHDRCCQQGPQEEQVLRDRPSRPFRCLDAQYRRELVRVYLTNVESICRRFCEDRRQRLSWLREEGSSFSAWWRSLSAERRKQLTTEKGEAILKGVVKQFFNEKEVTSTLVMDALYCGCRQLECLSRKKGSLPEGSAPPCVVINGKALTFSFALDALEVIAQLSRDFLPPLPNDKVLPVGADGLGLRSGCDEMSELRRDALERDEKRLAELGRRTVEMYAVAHVFTERLERAYRDHQAEKRMKDLIAEEEEAGRLEDERAAARAAADKEKRAKKKERKKAKKEADKAKRDAEDAERARQEAEKRAEIERRVAEANERRRQEELEVAAQQQQKQQDKKQQQQEAKAAAQRNQQPLANGDYSTAHEGPSANGTASSSEAHTHEQGKQQHQQQQAAAARSSSDAADAPSASSSAPAAGSSGRGMPAAGSKYSSSSSPAAPASVADDASEVTSTSDLDDSSSMEMGSSSSKGFTPVLGRHHAHHQQQQQQPGTASARGGQPPGRPPQQQQSAAGSSQQQQQQQPGSIPTGYAAAVAGMRTPPAAEVVSAAAALAEQARRYKQLEEQHRELEQQVSGYKQQVEGLEASVADRDAALSKLGATVARQEQELSQQEAVLSQRAAAIAQKDAALAQKDQQLAQLREQVAAQQQQVSAQQQQLVAQQQQLSELRTLQTKVASELRAVSSRGSSKDGGGVGRKVSVSSEDGAAAVGGSGRGRGHSGDLASAAEALASSSSVVDGYSPSAAPWAAVAAGTASGAGPVGSSLRDSGTASSSGSQDLAAAAANGLSSGSGLHGSGGGDGAAAAAAAASGPLSYAESVGGQGLPQHMAPPGLQSHPSGGSIGTPRAGAGAGPGPGSSGSSSGAPGTGRGSPAAAGDRLAGNRPRQGKEPAAAGAAADDSGIGRSRFVSSAPPQRQQQQHGSGMPASRAADGTRGVALGKGVQQAGAGSGSYLSNGIAGVLHSSVPPSSGSPGSSHAPLHSYRNAAAAAGAGGGSAAAAMGPSSIAAMGGAGGGAGAAATASGMLGVAAGVKGSGVGGGSLGGVGSKVPGSLAAQQQQQQQQQQHPFAYTSNLAGGGGFGSMAAAGPAAKGPNDASPAGGAGAAQHPTSTASSLALDDAGMDGFVHMHMIDELLTE